MVFIHIIFTLLRYRLLFIGLYLIMLYLFNINYLLDMVIIYYVIIIIFIGSLAILPNYFFLVLFFVSIPADPNRVPHDLPEAEPEPIAGFITEYSTIYFSLILLTEYGNIIALTYLVIFCFPLNPLTLVFILYFVFIINSIIFYVTFIWFYLN